MIQGLLGKVNAEGAFTADPDLTKYSRHIADREFKAFEAKSGACASAHALISAWLDEWDWRNSRAWEQANPEPKPEAPVEPVPVREPA